VNSGAGSGSRSAPGAPWASSATSGRVGRLWIGVSPVLARLLAGGRPHHSPDPKESDLRAVRWNADGGRRIGPQGAVGADGIRIRCERRSAAVRERVSDCRLGRGPPAGALPARKRCGWASPPIAGYRAPRPGPRLAIRLASSLEEVESREGQQRLRGLSALRRLRRNPAVAHARAGNCLGRARGRVGRGGRRNLFDAT